MCFGVICAVCFCLRTSTYTCTCTLIVVHDHWVVVECQQARQRGRGTTSDSRLVLCPQPCCATRGRYTEIAWILHPGAHQTNTNKSFFWIITFWGHDLQQSKPEEVLCFNFWGGDWIIFLFRLQIFLGFFFWGVIISKHSKRLTPKS